MNPDGGPPDPTTVVPAVAPPSRTAQLQLTPDAAAPAAARSFLAAQGGGLPPAMLDDAELLVSELISNAVRHGRLLITMTVRTQPLGLEVAVHDHGDDIPAVSIEPADTMKPSGRGLLIVDRLADAWGVIPADPPPGKTVWFTLGQHDQPRD